MIEGLVVAVVAGGLIAGTGFHYAGPWQFLMRWLVAVVMLSALFWGGAAFGAVARNAMCQGFWICE